MADDFSTEEWRAIKDWPAYEVSSLGRVRRVLAGKGTKTGILRQMIGKRGGYPVVGLRMMPRHTKTVVHRLVCEAFHGPAPFEGAHAAHWDGDPTNNRASNLRWASAKENGEDRVRHGTSHRAFKYSNARVRAIRRARNLGLSYSQLAKRFGVHTMTAYYIVQGKLRADA